MREFILLLIFSPDEGVAQGDGGVRTEEHLISAEQPFRQLQVNNRNESY